MRQANSDAVTVEEITTLAQFGALEREWRDAVGRFSGATIHLSFPWLLDLWRTFLEDGEAFFLVARDGQGIAGIAPWMREVRTLRGLKVPIIRLIGNDYSTRSDIMTLRRTDEVVEAFLERLRHRSWWVIDLGRVPSNSAALKSILNHAGGTFSSVAHRRSFETPFIGLDGTWDLYIRAKKKHFRAAVNRAVKLGENFTTKLFPRDSDGLDDFLRDIRRVSGNSWQGHEGTSVVSDEDTWAFYQSVMRQAQADGKLLLVCVYDGQDPIAFWVTVQFGDVLYGLKTGYDLRYSQQSPGFLATRCLVQAAFKSPSLRVLDFEPVATRGDWKYRWSTGIERVETYYLFRRSLAGAALGGLYTLRRRMQHLRPFRARSSAPANSVPASK